MSVTDLSESGTAPSAGHSKSRALSGSGDIEGFSLRDLHRRLHESSTKLTEDSCNFQARCMATRPLPVQEQIKFLSEAGLPSRPRTERTHAVHMRRYLVIRARFARLARKAGRVGWTTVRGPKFEVFGTSNPELRTSDRACRTRLACLAHDSRATKIYPIQALRQSWTAMRGCLWNLVPRGRVPHCAHSQGWVTLTPD